VHNQIRDLLEMNGIKLASVASNLMGVSGQRILRSLAKGESSAEQMSWKAVGKLRKKEGETKQAMKPEFGPFYRTTLTMFLEHYDFLSKLLTDFEAAIEKAVVPYAEQIALLQTIPGVEKIAAWQLIAELGVDMSVFPDGGHCASWAGLRVRGATRVRGCSTVGGPRRGTSICVGF